MNESSEIIGSMPSVPQPGPQPKTPADKPKPGNWGTGISFFLFAICLFAFPSYAHTDALGTGILYGMAQAFLLGFIGTVIRRIGQNRVPKTTGTAPGAKKSRRLQSLNGILLGVVLLLFGVYLLTSPVGSSGDLSITGLFFLVIGVVVLFFAVSGQIRRLGVVEDTPEEISVEQKQRSNNLMSGVVWLIFSMTWLVLPLGMGANALDKGMSYGFGLIMLLVALLVLSSAITGLITGTASPGK